MSSRDIATGEGCAEATSALPRPLAGVRVLDVTTGPMATIGRFLAELGGDVVQVTTTSADSIAAVAAGIGKRTVMVDPESPDDVDALIALAGGADIIIEDSGRGSIERRLVDAMMRSGVTASSVIASISPFGRSGGFSHWQSTGAILQAMSGALASSGLPDRAPLLPPGNLADAAAMPHITAYILSALVNLLRSGTGDHLDIALLDAVTLGLDPVYGMGGSAGAGLAPADAPRGRIDAGFQYPIFPCRDGYVRLCVLKPGQWHGMFRWMGSPADFADPAFDTLRTRFGSQALSDAMARFVAGQTRDQLERDGERHGVPVAGMRSPAEALKSPQVIARDAIVQWDFRRFGMLPTSNGAMVVDGVRMGPREPLPGTTIGATAWRDDVLPRQTMPIDPRGPLKGLRVLDLGVIVAGGELGRILADLGADVVKVESRRYPDGSRQTRDGTAMSRSFAAGHRNKRSLAIDLRASGGVALFLNLVRGADVMLSNFKPGTLDSLGLDAGRVRRENPRLICAESSAFGATGPWRGRLGYGPLVRAAMGLSTRWTYPGEPESFADAITIYPDHAAARTGMVAVLALLVARTRRGTGGRATIAQSEVILHGMAGDIACAAAGEAVDAGDWPRDAFPCSGDDEWCAIEVRDATDWQALCAVMTLDPVMDRAAAVVAIAGWTATRPSGEVELLLQEAGIPAARMLRAADLPDHPYFRSRGLFRQASHPLFDARLMHEGKAIGSRLLPDPPELPAPLCGDHSREVLRDWLCLSEEAIDRLVDDDIVQEPQPPAPEILPKDTLWKAG